MMKTTFYRWYDKILSSMLTLLGFGATTGFMACMYGVEYGPDTEGVMSDRNPNYNYLKVAPSDLLLDSEAGSSDIIYIQASGKWTLVKTEIAFQSVMFRSSLEKKIPTLLMGRPLRRYLSV